MKPVNEIILYRERFGEEPGVFRDLVRQVLGLRSMQSESRVLEMRRRAARGGKPLRRPAKQN